MRRIAIVALGFCSVLGSDIYAQSQVQDSIASSNNKLEEIVISGQFNPQSVNKSIHNVRVINRDQIERQGGSNLADILNQVLNINIIPNASTGKSGAKIFGLDAQYFTVLVDNVPIINDEGFGNNTDLTQINLEDISRIEIVEGAMGVDYGANAVSGIINIITKKSSQYDWEVVPYIQEESVGGEFDFKNKGKHIQSIKIGHKFNENIYASVSYMHNDFKGFWKDRLGKNYFGEEDLRGHNWLPKNQNNVKGLLNYYNDHYRVYYKFEYFNERIKDYNKDFEINENPIFGESNPFANDKIVTSNRFFHMLNASGTLRDLLNFDVTISYQKQQREVNSYNYYIKFDEKRNENNYKTLSQDGFYSRGTFSNFIKNDVFDFQLGYQISDINGFSSMEGNLVTSTPISRRLGSYDAYVSSEIKVTPQLMFRPGYRLMTSNVLNPHHAYSFMAKYVFPKGYELRATFGMAPRLPNYEELYTYFVDVNHDLQGNPDLKPEKGKTIFINLKKNFEINDDFEIENNFTARWMDVTDKIELIEIERSPKRFGYENVDRYRNLGLTYLNQITWRDLNVGIGFTYAAYATELFKAPKETDRFFFTPQINANIGYRIPKTKTNLSVFYKYTGSEYRYFLVDDIKGEYYVKGKTNGYSWLDFTIRQPFMDNKLHVTLGVRNLFNIREVDSSAIQGGAHEAASPSNMLLSYGTSGFVKVLYNFNF